MSNLNPIFRVRLCDFQLDAPLASARAQPPFVLRGRVDDKAFNTKGSSSLRPMWDDNIVMEYIAPSIEQLTSRYLVVEVYGGESFVGVCRMPLYQIATGPTKYHLDIKDGLRDVGKLDFCCYFEMICDVTLQFTRARIDNLPRLGYDETPNPYFAINLGPAGDVRESSVAANARSPEWSTLPSLFFRGTYTDFCQQKATLVLKHCRNGFSTSYSDPTMSTFSIAMDRFPIEPRMCSIPFRERFHSDVGFPFPFSSEFSGVIEFRNVHPVMQLAAGVRHDSGVVGGVVAVGQRSPPKAAPPSSSLPAVVRNTSPPRPGRSGASSNASASYQNISVRPPDYGYAPPTQSSMYLPPQQQQQSTYVPPHHAAAAFSNNASSVAASVPLPAVAPADLEVLDEVTQKQSALLHKVEARLSEISKRKLDVASQIAAAKVNEESQLELASQRKMQLDGDLRNALLEKDRLEEHLRSIQLRREDESRLAVQQAAERDRAKRALEEEQQEAIMMQQRVVQLRSEMTRHLEEEERRYQQRVREAEEARRRTQDDANALADLEARLAEAEVRATVRQKEDTARSSRRSGMSPPRYR